MFRLALLITLILSSGLVFGQRFMIKEANGIYAGISNPVSLLVEGKPCNSIVLKTDNGSIEFTNDQCWFTIKPQRVGFAEVQIFRRSRGKLLLVGTHTFIVSELPDPVPYVGNLKWGKVKKSSFIVMGGLIARGEEVHNDGMVERFNITIYRENQFISSLLNNGNRFEQPTLKMLELLQNGDRVVISSILVIDALGRNTVLRPIEYTIAD